MTAIIKLLMTNVFCKFQVSIRIFVFFSFFSVYSPINKKRKIIVDQLGITGRPRSMRRTRTVAKSCVGLWKKSKKSRSRKRSHFSEKSQPRREQTEVTISFVFDENMSLLIICLSASILLHCCVFGVSGESIYSIIILLYI